MNKRLITVLCVMALLITALGITAAAVDANTVATIGTQNYTSLEEAVADVSETDPASTVITLQKAAGALSFDKTAYLNLNGFDVASVTVAKNATLYCLDAATDDYDIDGDAVNGFSGYGRIVAVSGEGEVAGVVAGTIPTDDSTNYPFGYLDSYLMVKEAGKGLSFHRVNLQIKAMTLRAKEEDATEVNPSLYYKSAFAGDALVAEHVEAFGIALSVNEMPNADNMGVTNKYSYFEGAYFNAGENDDENTSTLLKGVMKESNAQLTNRANASMQVFGRAYIKTADGYVFGVGASRSLREQAELISENEWNKLSVAQKDAFVEMYRTYNSILDAWDLEGMMSYYEAAEKKVLRVLTLGHSLGLDSNHMLNLVFNETGHEQYDEVMIGSLYYSGCPLWRHARNLTANIREYSLHISSTKDPSKPLASIPDVTIAYAIDYEYWDIIIMQGGVWEIGQDEKYLDGNIQIIQDYIEEHKRNPELYLGWNMTWCPPVDDSLTNDNYKTSYTNNFNRDRAWMYENVTRCVESYIATDDHYKFIVPAATIFENALTSYLTEKDMHRDYVHASDLARLMVSHAFYCRIMGIDQLDEIKVDVVPTAFFKTHKESEGDWVLTEEEKTLILEAVNNALKNPYEVTKSENTHKFAERKILGIGNSYTIDSLRMLKAIYDAEGSNKNVTLGIAYNGGCSLSEHVGYIDANSADYSYYYLNKNGVWAIEKNVTLEYILQKEDWTYVSMQQSSDSSGRIATYKDAYFKTIKECVETNLGYEPVYMWNMTWAWPVEDCDGDGDTALTSSTIYNTYYGGDQMTMYNMIVDCVQEKICRDADFEFLMPVGTAIQNAKTSFLGDTDLHRDDSHVSDLGRLFAGYVWYCEIEKVTLDEIKLTTVPEVLTYSYKEGDMVISEEIAKVIVESVNNAISNKFAVTQSQFTEAQ